MFWLPALVLAQDTYILEKSIDILTEPGNFRKSEVIPPSTGEQLTVLRRAIDKDPKWWPEGVAIEIVSVNGAPQRPVKLGYVAKKWFERGTREGEVAKLPDPIELQAQVLQTFTPITACEIEVGEPPPPPRIVPLPARRDSYTELSNMVKATSTTRGCHNALRRWYRQNSMWKDLSRLDRARLIVDRSQTIARNIRVKGFVEVCAKALGLDSNLEKSALEQFAQSLSSSEIDSLHVSNSESVCQRFQSTSAKDRNLNPSFFRENAQDPNTIHPQFDHSLAICIIKREVSSTNFDPHSMNYSFCEMRGRQGRPRSTAHGLAQFTQTTFLSLREAGLMPLSAVGDERDSSTNRRYFREMSTNPDMQIETIFRYLNYLMKAPASSRIRHMHDQVYNDSFQDWEKAVIAYDQDRASAYIRGVHSCRRCIEQAGDNSEAQANCLAGQ